MLYNDRHADYLLVKDDEAVLLDYLATLVAKEYVVYNNPAAPAGHGRGDGPDGRPSAAPPPEAPVSPRIVDRPSGGP